MFTSINDFVKVIGKAKFGTKMVTMTEPKMRKTNNPYWGRVRKITYLANVALGYDYERVVTAHIEKVGGDKSDWVAEAPRGRHWVKGAYPFLLESDKDNTQYLRVFTRKNTTRKSVFVLDNKVVTDSKVADNIKSFCYEYKSSTKQEECGLTDENQVRPMDYKVSGILAISTEGKVYQQSNISIDFLHNEFFK